tara:strand:- start:474 stop:962 length:489 start_codon:yes stop_codon:yes gene_type:complete
MNEDLNTLAIRFDDPSKAFGEPVDRPTMLAGANRSCHGRAMDLQVEGSNSDAQAPHVILTFVLNRSKALLGGEGGGACPVNPWSATEVLDDLVWGRVRLRTTVCWVFTTKMHNGPVDWRKKDTHVLWDASRRISKTKKKPRGSTKQNDAEQGTQPKKRVDER